MIDKQILLLTVFLFLTLVLFGQAVRKETRLYTTMEAGEELKMDIYKSDSVPLQPQPCLMFVFGGGFKEGKRDAEIYSPFFNYFAVRGFTVVSIDYRLGMKGQKAPGIFNNKPLRNAIDQAVADLYSATAYLLENAGELRIDPSLIIISGSSAGAITVLQADYEKRDKHPSADVLPEDFRYAGVISFAGAIFSTEGVPSYAQRPAPTLFFHGSADKLVPYDKTRFFSRGMFGSKSLAKKFRSERYPYMFYSMENVGHEASEYPMQEFLPEIEQFISDYVFDSKQWMTDIRFKDMFRKSDNSTTPGNYYN
ncbi:alpha/beta hydrolase [uncultured Proteiniphilum sp.]|uniref:alpha/beta hydrolase n=1 Tax=uncultured Proteiniphilum sp. TaxID=497637 RepID=UPI00262C3E0F|nr:alpha/beta hydrolase [uncultured Proteiniphilum sp.]